MLFQCDATVISLEKNNLAKETVSDIKYPLSSQTLTHYI